ncbi:amino acid permease [Acidimicrobiaceae bacterium]|nr:amino acid permease [Acidimicrobiaceae bacterium]
MDNFKRTLTLQNSLFLGLSSMIGAGLFVNIAPTAVISSYSLILGLVIASFLAFANASSSAQLARVYPETGGTYLYARKVLGNNASLFSGIVFIVGKIISSIAIALTFGNYLMPSYPKTSGVMLVLLVGIISYFGATKTASVARWFVYSVVGILMFYIFSITTSTSFNFSIPISEGLSLETLLISSSIWFFAFTGYSRLATFGEEVRNPEKIIPKAILIGLGLTVTIYFLVTYITLGIVDPSIIQNSSTPLKVAFDLSRFSNFSFLISIASTIATGSVLLALIPGISRVAVAMSRDKYLPTGLSKIHKKYNSAYIADVSIALIVILGILTVDVIEAIKMSSFFILLYYSLTNLSVIKLKKSQRLYSILIPYFGLLGCLLLASSLFLNFLN